MDTGMEWTPSQAAAGNLLLVRKTAGDAAAQGQDEHGGELHDPWAQERARLLLRLAALSREVRETWRGQRHRQQLAPLLPDPAQRGAGPAARDRSPDPKEERCGARIDLILSALERMESGDYGYCRICGVTVGQAFLRAHPETPFCESCSA